MSRKRDTQKGTSGPPVRDVNASARVSLALKLRAAKVPYAQIAQQVGFANATSARRAILRELDRTVVEGVEDLRKQELSLLDQLHTECWKLVMDKDNKGRLWAIDRVLAISEARRKLMGMDTPIDSALNANMVVVREVPYQYLEGPKNE